MAKKITGCDWTYQVIEGMDAKIAKLFQNLHPDDSQRKSALAPRSGLNELNKTLDLDSTGYSHLAPSAYLQKRELHKDKGQDLHKKASSDDPATNCKALPRRPKVFVMDLAWKLDDPLMPNKVTFLTETCAKINEKRCESWGTKVETVLFKDGETGETEEVLLEQKRNSLLHTKTSRSGTETCQLHHGAACVGALRISNKPTDPEIEDKHLHLIWGHEKHKEEAALWNLSPRSDIVLVPMREHAEISIEAYRNCLQFYLSNQHKLEKPLDPDLVWLMQDFEDLIFRFLNAASKSDDFRNMEMLREELELRLKEDLPPHLAGVDLKANTNALINIFEPAFQEAGYAATLDLILKASKDGQYAGRGDTLVVPMHFELWRKDPKFSFTKTLRDMVLDGQKMFEPQESEAHQEAIRPNPMHVENIELPIIVMKMVEDRVRKLTCKREIAVIISAGNSHIDLGQLKMREVNKALPTRRKIRNKHDEEKVARSLFRTRGCDCGAIIVGSGPVSLVEFWADPFGLRFRKKYQPKIAAFNTHCRNLTNSLKRKSDPLEDDETPSTDWVDPDDHRRDFANFGMCVDAFGRGSAKDVHNLREKMRGRDGLVVAEESYAQWGGASIAAMVTAACLANVQHIRLLWNYIEHMMMSKANADAPLGRDAPEEAGTKKRRKPNYLNLLKPYEARAHFQQWRSNDAFAYDCLEDLMGAPPDIKSWFRGTCVRKRLRKYAKDGKNIIRENCKELDQRNALPPEDATTD